MSVYTYKIITFNSPKPNSKSKKDNSKVQLNISTKTNKLTTRKNNKRQKDTIKSFLTINNFNRYGRLDNSESRSIPKKIKKN